MMLLGWTPLALAGAWTKSPGEAYAKAGADWYAAIRYVSPGERAELAPAGSDAYFGQQYGVYVEAGVLPRRRGQLSLSLPLTAGGHRVAYEDAFGARDIRATTVRTGDLRLSAQTALHRTLPLAIALDLKLPTYRNGTVGERYPAYQRLFPKPGDGQVDLGVMLYGGFTPWAGGFTELGVGYLHRTERFVGWAPDPTLALSDGLRLSAKAGHRTGPLLSLLGAEATLSPRPTPYTRSFVALSLSALLDLAPGWALEPRLAGEIWTQHASQGVGAGLGLSYRR